MTFIETVIARCTRNGHISWAQVAKQLGRPVESVRQEFDPTYRRQPEGAPQ